MKRAEREALRKRLETACVYTDDGDLDYLERLVAREIDRERRRAKAVEAELQEAEELETKRAKGER